MTGSRVDVAGLAAALAVVDSAAVAMGRTSHLRRNRCRTSAKCGCSFRIAAGVLAVRIAKEHYSSPDRTSRNLRHRRRSPAGQLDSGNPAAFRLNWSNHSANRHCLFGLTIFLGAMAGRDADALRAIPQNELMAGTSECKSWIATSAAMNAADLNMRLVNYQTLIRTEGGTGSSCAFTIWE